MENNFLDTAKQRMEQMQNSPEYQASCRYFSSECARLEAIATELLTRSEELQAHCEANTVRKEYASGSTLHRGFYCPSPAYDLIVVGTKRGKLLKRFTAASKPSHEYGFDANGRLLYCKWFHNGQPADTEYLVYEEHCIYGITMSKDGNLTYFTEEALECGRLTDYSHCMFLPLNGVPSCLEISQEHYEYDTQGLSSCDMHHYMQTKATPPGLPESVLAMIPKEVCRHIGKFQFQRENGLLVSYTNQQGREYQVLTQRKA